MPLIADTITTTSDPPPPTPERVFHEFGPRVYNLARRMLGNDADAEDVTQDVLLQVVRNLDSFRGDSALSTWLHRVTVNAALAFRRKASNRREKPTADPYAAFIDDGRHLLPIRPWSLRPDEQAIDNETQELVENAIAELPDTFRDVYLLSDVEGLPNAEIGDILGLSVPAVKSRLHRARLLMRGELARHFEEVAS